MNRTSTPKSTKAANSTVMAFPGESSGPKAIGKQKRKHVLLIFSLLWDDSKAILKGIAHFAESRWNVMIDVDGAALKDLSWLTEQNWDGIITRHTNAAFINEVRRLKIPVVDLNDSPIKEGAAKVRHDNRAVGHMGAEHLLERGFKHFAFCGLSEPWSREREAGYKEALQLAGMACTSIENDYQTMDPRWNDKQMRVIRSWLRELPRPIAIMSCNDLRALQVSNACNEEGLLVPNEVAVLGVNNDFIRCAFGSPPLSSVATDRQLAGFRASELLDRLMNSGTAESSEEIRIEPLRVVVRRSTDVLAVDDEKVRLALHYIHENACASISAEDVANHVGLSRYALERKFRQHMGHSPHDEIGNVKIGRIKQLLIETDLPIKNIADLVGVPHTEYVNVLFSRKVGMPPGAYRKKHQSQSDKRLDSPTNPDHEESD